MVHLNLTGIDSLTDVGMRACTAAMDQLRSIRVSGCLLLTDQSIRRIPTNCPALELLDVSGCRSLTDVSFYVVLDNYQLENQFQLFQRFIVTGCARMGVEEYGVKENFQALQKQYDGCIIECSSFGTMIDPSAKRKKVSGVLRRFPDNFKKNYILMDRNSSFAKKVVGKKIGGGRKKKKGRRKKK